MSRRGWVLFALMSVLWGIPYLMIKVAVDGGISVPVLVFARTALGAAVLLPLAVWSARRTGGGRGRRGGTGAGKGAGTPAAIGPGDVGGRDVAADAGPADAHAARDAAGDAGADGEGEGQAGRGGDAGALRRRWKAILAFAIMEIIGPWALLSDAERHLSSSMTGLLIAAVPIVGVVLARLVPGDTERLGPVRWGGLLLGLGGVAVLAAPHLDGGSAWAVGEIMLVVLGYSSAPMIAARRLGDVPSLPMTAACLTVAALVYAGPAAATWPGSLPAGEVLAALAGLGFVCTALAFLVFFELIREAGTSRAMVFTYVNPAVAVTAGVIFLDEALTGTILAAFALILCGSILATARRAGPVPRTGDGSDPVPGQETGPAHGAGLRT